MEQVMLYTKYPKQFIVISIFILATTVIKSSLSQPFETDCPLNFQNLLSTNDSSLYEGEWGGFLNNIFCEGTFQDYLYALGQRANQTGKIFLNAAEQTNCLAEGKNSKIHVLGCGIEKLTSGGGGCSDFSVGDVTFRLGGNLRNLQEKCQFPSLGGGGNQSCSSCVRSWKEIRETKSNNNGEKLEVESHICRFAVLISLTSSRIEDQIWIKNIYQCLEKQDSAEDIDSEPVKKTGSKKISSKIANGAIIGSCTGIAVISIVFIWILLKRRHKSNEESQKDESKSTSPEESSYLKVSVREVYAATNNLNESNFIGEGTAGKVYKGILSNKKKVAVKHIYNDGHAETFLREVSSLSQVRHPNLVDLLGYCKNEDEFFLIYELCPNGNLSEWLFGKDKVLAWIQRLKIAIDSARGLWFLHTYPEGCIVHRDIKPTNILLGTNFEAKLSDFGLSKVIDLGESYVSSEVRGTFGYVDPEYQVNHQVNSLGDVYSFGIVLLQIISGKKVINMNLKTPMSLDKMAKYINRSGSIVEFADPKLDGEYSPDAFDLAFNLALSCTSLKQQRPSMEHVVLKLEEALHLSTKVLSSTTHTTSDWTSTP